MFLVKRFGVHSNARSNSQHDVFRTDWLCVLQGRWVHNGIFFPLAAFQQCTSNYQLPCCNFTFIKPQLDLCSGEFWDELILISAVVKQSDTWFTLDASRVASPVTTDDFSW